MAKTPKKTKSNPKTHKKVLKAKVEEHEKASEISREEKDRSEELQFMRKLSKDIQRLNEEAEISSEYNEPNPEIHMIHHVTSTPWGIPFVSDANGPDTAVSFEFQDLSQPDLSHIMLDLREYNSLGNNQMFLMLDSAYEDLDYEDLETW